MAKEIRNLSKEKIISLFPLLGFDTNFAITSDASASYNCIAWAFEETGVWMEPGAMWRTPQVDVTYFWPADAEESSEITGIINIFKQRGYNICETWEHEAGYEKVALYVRSWTTRFSHASRELTVGDSCGVWTSKLGKGNDICHSSPYFLEGILYGEIYCIMKRISKL
jgi:hypothetical protein